MLNKRCIQARQYGMEVLDFWIRGETARVESRKLRERDAGCSQRLHDLGLMAPPFPGVKQGEEFDQQGDFSGGEKQERFWGRFAPA